MLDLDAFMAEGFLKIEHAAPRSAADAARAMLWRQLGLSPDEPEQWSAPVRWTADMTGQGPFGELARSPALAAALDQICGTGGWLPRGCLGNIAVRTGKKIPWNPKKERIEGDAELAKWVSRPYRSPWVLPFVV